MRERQLTDAAAGLLYGQPVDATDAPNVKIPGVTQTNWGPDYVRAMAGLVAFAKLADNLRPFLIESDAGVADEAKVGIRPGRLTLDATAFTYAGAVEAVTAIADDDTTYIWLEDDSGLTVGSAIDGTGWPGGTHFKIATVTRASGVITDLTDLRAQSLFAA